MPEHLVRDLMSPNVLCASPEMPVSEVVALMHEHGYSCLVISQDTAPVGIITQRDLVGVLDQILNQEQSADLAASQFMSQPVLTVREDAPVFEAMVLCQARNLRHMPVVDRFGRLSGLLTQSDLTRAHMRSIEEQRILLENAGTAADDLVIANDRLKALAHEDALLRIGNRRAMEVDLHYTHEASLRYGTVYSVALCDVDFFKQYNDTYGHEAGDNVLKTTVDYLKGAIRKSDRLYRYGGDELLLLLPMTQVEDARMTCERLLEDLVRLAIPHQASAFGVLTLSCGISGVGASSRGLLNWRQVFDEAENALHRVKHAGRNGTAAFRSVTNRGGRSRHPSAESPQDYRGARASRR